VIERAIERQQHPPTNQETIERWRALDKQDQAKDQQWSKLVNPSG
jgi:hypothetical protein